MKIDVQYEISRALNKDIQNRIGNDDPSITYQEFFFFWILRGCSTSAYIDIDEKVNVAISDGWIDSEWLKTKAAKINKHEFLLSWDKVFDY